MRHNCHEFANKLWSDMAIYSYALTAKANVWDLARFETGLLAPLHKAAAILVRRANASAQYVALPPTAPLEGKFANKKNLYFFGWLYKNPTGFNLYRKELVAKFGPTKHEDTRINKILTKLPPKRITIGVCLRLEPYLYFPDGEFLVPPERVRNVLEEYLSERKLDFNQVAIVLVADKLVPPHIFKDFIVYEVENYERTNLFLLSKCSVIIGPNMSFCTLAAWFGNVAHIVATKNPIDWEYYRNKLQYFENKYATFALGVPGQE